MYLNIVLIPGISALLTGFFGKFIGQKGAILITTTGVFLSFIFSCIAFYEVALCGSPCYIELFSWIKSGYLYVNWGFQFDSLTVVMLIVVTSISTLVHVYSIGYMSHDPHIPRFFSYLSVFTFFMLILVTANNFLQLFLGWEGVGVSSYLLINFWFTRIQANKSAMKAMIVNRVGDFGLSLGIILLFYLFKSVNFSVIFPSVHMLVGTNIIFFNNEVDALTLAAILLFIGAVGKSAQIGLHTWLPDAMEGPTPVSALIHAATMVTAGVFLIIRCSPLLEYTPNALLIITIVGALTAFFAATTGVAQNDLKRVIAYSTCSQLGYMVFACGLSSYSVSAFHLMNHAFFKALLFLCAGSIIHAMSDEQDIRRMGGIYQMLPITYILMVIGSLSLMGIPFLTGFYSKDVILELAYSKFVIYSHFAYWLGTMAAFFTAYYSIRLIYFSLMGKRTNAYREVISNVHESPNIMLIPLLILGAGSIFVGYLAKDMMIGFGTDFWGNSILILPQNVLFVESEFIPQAIKNKPVIYSIIGGTLAWVLNRFFINTINLITTSSYGLATYKFLNRKWYFDNIYNHYIVKSVLWFGYHVSFKTLDRGFIELFGPYGLARLFTQLSSHLRNLQSGLIYHYIFIFIIGITILVLITLFNLTFYLDIRVILIWLLVTIIVSFIRK